MRRLAQTVLTAALPLALVACGGDDTSSSGGDDRASKPARRLLEDTAAELRKVRTYHLEGTSTDKDGESTMRGDVSADGSLSVRMTLGGAQLRLVVADGQTYMKADGAFWRRQGGRVPPAVARLLSDRWVKAPAAAADDIGGSLDELLPSTLAYCTTKTIGTVTTKGTESLDGQEVVVVEDKGDRPGVAPGKAYIAASGRPLPVRVVQTGPRSPGGTLDPRCDDANSTTTRSDIRLSRFDAPLDIKPPPGALDLESLQGAGAATLS